MSKSQALNKLLIVMALLMLMLVSIQSRSQSLQTTHQNLTVSLYPSLKMIKAEARITFPKNSPRKITFLLNKNLNVTVQSHGDTLRKLRTPAPSELYAVYGIELSNQDHTLELTYYGIINDPVVNDQSQGLISPEGVALFGSTYWYPTFSDFLTTFELRVQTPGNWKSLTQGQISGLQHENNTRWTTFKEIYPQESIYLIAGPFFQFERQVGAKLFQVLLRKNESTLAQTYLDLIPNYVQKFSEKIGPYPYTGFTVVENFWETGFGMPGFTLLGPSVIRLPYILNSSLPHEILHNWWGNSVYVDPSFGNWSEGLTTYMADHAIQAEAQQDRTYRVNTLIQYQDYVTNHKGKDFPLKDFRSKDSASSQAIGYGKSLFLFHMLEVRVGKDLFKKSIQDFYQNYVFKTATFIDIQKTFEKVTKQDLSGFFNQWLNRKGAPTLSLENVQMTNGLDGVFNVTYKLRQSKNHDDFVYDLIVPIQWTLENGSQFRQTARLNKSTGYFSFTSRIKPTHLSVDPLNNVFRNLHLEEKPATLSSFFGSKKVHFFYDARSTEQIKFAQTWSGKVQGAVQFSDIAVEPPKEQEGDWVLIGDHPEIYNLMKKELVGQSFHINDETISINGETYSKSESSTVLVTRSLSNPERNIIWVRWSPNNNPQEWAERLTHYGTFGILVFKGRNAVQRGTWPVLKSPLLQEL